MHSSQKLTCSPKKKDPEKNNRTAQEVFLRILHCNSSINECFFIRSHLGYFESLFLNLEAKYGEFLFIIGYMLLGINRKKIMLGNNNVFFVFEIVTLTGFLRHHHLSVLWVTSGDFESIAKLVKKKLY